MTITINGTWFSFIFVAIFGFSVNYMRRNVNSMKKPNQGKSFSHFYRWTSAVVSRVISIKKRGNSKEWTNIIILTLYKHILLYLILCLKSSFNYNFIWLWKFRRSTINVSYYCTHWKYLPISLEWVHFCNLFTFCKIRCYSPIPK